MSAALRRVCVVGIGRVGLPLALALQEAGFEVVGIDRDPALLAAIRRHAMPFQEPGFDERKYHDRLLGYGSPPMKQVALIMASKTQ